MKAVVIYESLTGNTRKAAGIIAAELEGEGHQATTCSTTAIDYQAIADADLVIVGTWTDGMVFVGQRPGRAGRLRKLPYLSGKRCVAYCTYAIDPGHTLDKFVAILEERGAEVLGGFAIRRDNLVEGCQEFVDRILAVVTA